jgi:hypothetical protein
LRALQGPRDWQINVVTQFRSSELDFRGVALWSLSRSSKGSDRCWRIEISRLWYHLMSPNRAYLTRRTRNKTIPASYRLTVRGDERTAVLRISHDTTAIAAELRVIRSYTAVRRSKSNALNWSYEATSRSAYTAVLEIGERKRDR